MKTAPRPDILVLGNKDRDAFLRALSRPPRPLPRLRAAVARYRKQTTGR